jgi:mono/diheme cytochrome c family protein
MLTTRTPEAHQWALEQFKTFSCGGQFIPFSLDKQTIVLPGFDGGAEWGGPAVDPRSGVIYINANDLAWTGGLTENRRGSPGTVIYQTQCAICHGGDRAGNPPAFPSLVNIDKRLTPTEIVEVIHNGKGRMPGFPSLHDARLNQLMDFMNHAGSGGPSLASVSASGGTDPVGSKLYSLLMTGPSGSADIGGITVIRPGGDGAYRHFLAARAKTGCANHLVKVRGGAALVRRSSSMKVQCHRSRRTKDIWMRRSFGAGARWAAHESQARSPGGCQSIASR